MMIPQIGKLFVRRSFGSGARRIQDEALEAKQRRAINPAFRRVLILLLVVGSLTFDSKATINRRQGAMAVLNDYGTCIVTLSETSPDISAGGGTVHVDLTTSLAD